MNLIETHAHIYSKKFDADRKEVILRSAENGVRKIYMPNIDLSSIDAMLRVEEDFPDICVPMMGLHPCDVDADFEKTLYVMEDWLNKRPFAAVGETGIDLYWDKTYFEQQQESLKIHIQWAKERALPVVLHCRESMKETIDLVKNINDDKLSGIFHCFSGTLEQAREIIDMGFYLGIGGTVTYRNSNIGEVLAAIGLEKVVLETDSPYLAPVPFRGKRNSPEYIPHIAGKIAEHTSLSVGEVADITTRNAMRIFNLSADEL
ncbi:TatD family hydrolase [Negadavirga shengliensis]|uniref:TatD family hydrolase n=1 Tax=Negadavirga shengliensis TaxID=1389218 RepID=A0ABV9T4D0_9BACT